MKDRTPTWRELKRRPAPEIVAQPYFRYLIICMIGIWAVMMWFDYMNPAIKPKQQTHLRTFNQKQNGPNVRQVLYNNQLLKRPSLDTVYVAGNILGTATDNQVGNDGSTDSGSNSAPNPRQDEESTKHSSDPFLRANIIFTGKSNPLKDMEIKEPPLLPADANHWVDNMQNTQLNKVAKVDENTSNKALDEPNQKFDEKISGVSHVKFIPVRPLLPMNTKTGENKATKNLHKNLPKVVSVNDKKSIELDDKPKKVENIGGEVIDYAFSYKMSPKFKSIGKQHSQTIEDEQTETDNPTLTQNTVNKKTNPVTPEGTVVLDDYKNW